MTRTTWEFVLNAMYAALVAAMDARQRAIANDILTKRAGLPGVPADAAEILRRIVRNATV